VKTWSYFLTIPN